MENRVEEFLDYLLKEKQSSPLTCLAYRTDLEQFQEFLKEQGCENFEIEKWRAKEFVEYLRQKNYKKKTLIRKMGTLKSFYKYLFRHQKVQKNPWRELKTPFYEEKTPLFFEESEIEKLFLSLPLPQNFKEKQERVVLELLYSSGMCLSELVKLHLEDVDLEKGLVKIKGRKERERFSVLGSPAREAVSEYLKERQSLEGEASLLLHPQSPFLVQSNGRALSLYHLRQILKKQSTLAGLENCTPYRIRHSFAQHLLQHGAHIKAVQELLGHKNLATTQRYALSQGQRLHQVYQKAHPLKDFKEEDKKEGEGKGEG
jgi:site-specific recombinase XerD